MRPLVRKASALAGVALLGSCIGLDGNGVEPQAGATVAVQTSAVGRAECAATTSLSVATVAGGTKTVTTAAQFTNPVAPCLTLADPDDPDYMTGDANIATELIRLIRSAQPYSTIRGHIYNVNLMPVAIALHEAAVVRNVNVQLSLDAKYTEPYTGAVGKLKDTPGTIRCLPGRPCLSNAEGGIAHTKLFTFSATTRPGQSTYEEAVWFGSFNLTSGADGNKGFNNAITVYNDHNLFVDLEEYARHLHDGDLELVGNDFYIPSGEGAPQGYWPNTSAVVYASPDTTMDANGKPARDMVVERLNDYTPSSACKVMVSMAHFSGRSPVIAQLAQMKAGGCEVRVLGIAKYYSANTFSLLANAGIPVRSTATHDKFIAIYANRAAVGAPAAYEYRVFTGSHNLTLGTQTENDEIFVKMRPETGSTHALYDAYKAHFDSAWAEAGYDL